MRGLLYSPNLSNNYSLEVFNNKEVNSSEDNWDIGSIMANISESREPN
jgi:hypothetical protein